jgi:hypothetical protein
MDEIRNRYSNCLEKEIFMDSPNQEHFFKNLGNFYSPESGLLYPYDVQRFILPYLADNNIINFALIDSDLFLKDDVEFIKSAFNSINPKTLYNTWFNTNINASKRIYFLNDCIKPKYKDIDFNIDNPSDADGFIRGFNFENSEDVMLFFNLWNSVMEELLSDLKYREIYGGSIIMDTAWVCPYIMELFFKMGYNKLGSEQFLVINGERLGIHCTRPEDTFYFGQRGYWDKYEFKYDNVNTISDFICKNKKQLETYYNNHIETIEITDTHVYNYVI